MKDIVGRPLELKVTIDGALYAAYCKKQEARNVDPLEAIEHRINVHMQAVCQEEEEE